MILIQRGEALMQKTTVLRVQMGHKCLICETRKTKGYKLLHSFICQACEQKVVQSEAGTEDYSMYVQKMRKMIAGN